jgi:two-component system response regulator GlrR
MFQPEKRRAPDSDVSGQFTRARILVVEDQEDLRGLLVTALETEGHEVDEACNAREGLARLQQAQYDLVLTDYAMPGGTGTWMLHEAECQGLLTRTAALIVTAHADARELAGREIIAKPLDLDHFLDHVKRVLSGVSARQQHGADEDGGVPLRAYRVELVLYVSPNSPASLQARRNLEQLLQQFEAGQIKYSVCDLVRDPLAGESDRVAFTPTLVKRYPAPRTWVLGNLREPEIVGDLLRVCGVDAMI